MSALRRDQVADRDAELVEQLVVRLVVAQRRGELLDDQIRRALAVQLVQDREVIIVLGAVADGLKTQATYPFSVAVQSQTVLP